MSKPWKEICSARCWTAKGTVCKCKCVGKYHRKGLSSSEIETLEIMEDKKVMKLIRKSRESGSSSSPYKPLTESEK